MSRTKNSTKYGTGKEAILNATVEVVATRGLRGLTFRAVAASAGVNNSLIVHHFGTRDALIAAALDWATSRSIAVSQLSELANSEETFRQALLAMLTAELDLQVFQFEMIIESRRRPELVAPVRELYANYVTAVSQAVKALGLDPLDDALARTVFGALDGLVLQYLTGFADDAAVEASLSALWQLLRARVPEDATGEE